MEQVKIQRSKTKILLLLLMGIGMAGLSCKIFITPDQFVSPIFRSAGVIKVVGLIGAIFFGACLVMGLKMLLDPHVGITINAEGITDNSSGCALGMIPWRDIEGFGTTEIQHQKILLVMVSNPEDYVAKSRGLKNRLAKINIKLCGTPICISSNGLNCSFKELEQVLTEALSKYKS